MLVIPNRSECCWIEEDTGVVWMRGGGAGAFLVGEKTAALVVGVLKGELLLDAEMLFIVEELNILGVEAECESGNIVIIVDGEAGVALVEGRLSCSAEATGAADGVVAGQLGAEGVVAGKRRRSANAERDLRS